MMEKNKKNKKNKKENNAPLTEGQKKWLETVEETIFFF